MELIYSIGGALAAGILCIFAYRVVRLIMLARDLSRLEDLQR